MLVSPAEQPLLAEQQSRLERVLQIARTNDTEAALRSYVNVILDTDVFDKLPEGSRVVIRDNFSTLAPMLTTFFEPVPLDCSSAGRSGNEQWS